MSFDKIGNVKGVEILSKDGWKSSEDLRMETLETLKVECPVCHKLIPLKSEKCPHCGHEFVI